MVLALKKYSKVSIISTLLCAVFCSAALPVVTLAQDAEDDEDVGTIVVEDYAYDTLPFDPSTGDTKQTGLNGQTIPSLTDEDDGLRLGTGDPSYIFVYTLNVLLTLLGIIFLVLLVYAGVIWIMARGAEDQITKAKTIIKRAVIGLVIVLSAYGISNLTFTIIANQTNIS